MTLSYLKLYLVAIQCKMLSATPVNEATVLFGPRTNTSKGGFCGVYIMWNMSQTNVKEKKIIFKNQLTKIITGKTIKLKFSPPKSTRGGKDVAKLVRNKSKIAIDDGNNKVPRAIFKLIFGA